MRGPGRGIVAIERDSATWARPCATGAIMRDLGRGIVRSYAA